MNKFDNFPIDIDKFRGLPINSHPGAFGCARKFNFHEGIDLYGSPGDGVFAIRDGVVVANMPFTGPKTGYGWWLDTDAILVKDDTGYYVYGELKSDLKVGDNVEANQKIGQLVPVLEDYKTRNDIPGHSVTMLHLERYSLDYDIYGGWSSWDKRENRPKYLIDPTLDLINILTNLGLRVNFLPL